MNKIFLLCVFIASFNIPSYAQFIGIRIGIPPGTRIVGAGGGGGGLPANVMTFNGVPMTFNGAYMTFTHS